MPSSSKINGKTKNLATSQAGGRTVKYEPINYEAIDVDKFVEHVTKDMNEAQKTQCEMIKYVASRKYATKNRDRSFMNRESLAPEMPSSLIPIFSGKAHVWAERVQNILLARGITDFNDDLVTQTFLPVILSKLPPDVARDAPVGGLEEVLAYLKNIDKIRYDLNQCFVEGRKLQKSPSQAFSALVNRARKALPSLDAEGRPDGSVIECTELHKTVAWTSLKAGLPPSLLALATALGIRYFPTQENLEILDDAWADHMAAKEVPSVFSIKRDEQTGKEVSNNVQNKQL